MSMVNARKVIDGIITDLERFLEDKSWVGIQELKEGLQKEVNRGYYD